MPEQIPRITHNKPATPQATVEAVVFDQGGNPVLLDPVRVLEEARQMVERPPSFGSASLPIWSQLRQLVLVADMSKRNLTPVETADAVRWMRLLNQV